jgi:hypothetical protein
MLSLPYRGRAPAGNGKTLSPAMSFLEGFFETLFGQSRHYHQKGLFKRNVASLNE